MNFSAIPRDTAIGKALRAPLALIPGGLVVPVLQGPLRGARWIIGSAPHGCWLGSYETDTQRCLAKVLRPGMTVFDIGANVGFFTLLAARLVAPTGIVIAFEPLPRNVELLQRHLALNAINNVTVSTDAVSDHFGSAMFVVAGSASMGKIGTTGTLPIQTITLDDCVHRYGAPDFVKMDIEGGEVAALQGDFLRRIRPALFLSTHGSQRHRTSLELLDTAGYVVTEVGREASPGHRDILAIPR